jgi:translocating chain-associated membrane protein 1
MVLVIGLMFQVTSPVTSMFVTLQHNVTVEVEGLPDQSFYTYGVKDLFAVFFYALICIVIHAVIQEYIFDKLNRRMHLSKVKHSKFNESGQLVIFYAVSAIWGIDLILREKLFPNISRLWEGYPHVNVPFWIKFYYIIQLAYWIHSYPELYFQKIKKDDIWPRLTYITMYLVFIAAGYTLNLTRLALVLLVLHYTVEMIFHGSRLLYFSEKAEIANYGFKLWNILFVLVRLGTITLSVLTLWYGLSKTSSSAISFVDGNFNTQFVRGNCLTGLFLVQAWVMWNFITFHLHRARERANTEAALTSKKVTSPASPIKKKKNKAAAAASKEEESRSDLSGDEPTPVAENGTVRQRGTPRHR